MCQIVIFLNNGEEEFSEVIVDSNFIGAHTVDVKDVNGDEFLDVLCSGFDLYNHEGEIAWWENDGNDPITWTKHLISDRFQQSPFIFAEDMDNDDDMDVIACGELNDEILWWENDGDQFFTEHMVDSLFDAAHTTLVRDVDLDGDMDILGAACLSGSIAWYENDGIQQFIKHSLPTFPGALWIDATDLDNDGDRDLFGAGQGSGMIAWWENDGSQGWTKHFIDDRFQRHCSVDCGDFDEDGDLDIVVGEHNLKFPELARVFVFYNNLADKKQWDVKVVYVGDEHHNGVQLLDYDNDGDLDIVSIGWSHDAINLYENPLK